MKPATFLLVVGFFSVDAWLPVGPWQKPTIGCMRDYGQRLVLNQNLYKNGCRETVPDGLISEVMLSADACVQWCFDYYFAEPPIAPMPPNQKPLLNYTTLFNVTSGVCYCSEELIPPTPNPEECPILVTLLPTGCMFEQKEPCSAAPADGCIWTLDDCCVDAAGFDWPEFRNLVPWWAWGVGAVLLLLSSLLGLIVRARNRFAYTAVGGQGDEIDQGSIARLKEEYEELLKDLAEEDKRFLEREEEKKRLREEGREDEITDTDDETPEVCVMPQHEVRQNSSDQDDDEAFSVDEAAPLVPTPINAGQTDLLSSFNSDAQGGTCPVCLEDLVSVPCVRLKCGHRLRLTCMQEYVDHSVTRGKIPACPICRAKILTPSREEGVDL